MRPAASVEDYIQLGFNVIPVWPPSAGYQCGYECGGQCVGKRPIYEHSFDRPFDSRDFGPDDNVALKMGAWNNPGWLVALDTDGEIDLSPLGPLPETMTTKTGRGYHYIYTVPEDTPLANWTDLFYTRDKVLGYKPGYAGAVDMRYARGAVLAPPSIHKNGFQYEALNDLPPMLLSTSMIQRIILFHRQKFPKVKHYTRWTLDPQHKDKKP